MRTIWNTAAGLAAIPLSALSVAEKAATVGKVDVPRAPAARVQQVTWEKPVSTDLSRDVVIELTASALPLRRDEEKRFHKLAVQAALGEMSDTDRKDFTTLHSRRIKTQRKLPVEVIERRERILRMMDNLIAELAVFNR